MNRIRRRALYLLALASGALVLAGACKARPSAAEASSAAGGSELPGARLRSLLVAGRWDEALKLTRPAARWIEHANGSEGLIQTNTPILLDWDVCVPRGGTNLDPVLHPTIYPYPWLEFAQTSNGWTATLHLKADSWPWTAWQIRLQQVDRAGAFVVVHHKAEKTLENSGTIERIPELENLEVTFPLELAADSGVPRGTLYQISLATLWTEQGNPVQWGEAMPLALNLPTAAQSRVFNAESLTLVQTGASVQATVQAELISWPKMRWQLALALAGVDGKPVGRAEHLVENIGAIISRPSWSHPTFQFAVPGDPQALDTARRWTLRIESLPPEPRPKGI